MMDPSKLKDLLEKSISYLANAAASIDNPTSSNNSTSTNNRPTSQLLALSDSIDTKKKDLFILLNLIDLLNLSSKLLLHLLLLILEIPFLDSMVFVQVNFKKKFSDPYTIFFISNYTQIEKNIKQLQL